MKINDRYEIRVVVIEIREGIGMCRSLGDIYDDFAEFRRDKPESDYKFGYVVFDTEYGYVPDGCHDWNDSVEEAMFDYEENVEPYIKEKEFAYKVCLCDGRYCDGIIKVKAETEEDAYENAMDYVLGKLSEAFPELGIEVSLELVE